jgi:hypothetical protein
MADRKWIGEAIKRPGQLHRDLGVPLGKKIPEALLDAAAKREGKVGQRARLALRMREMNPWDVMHDDDGWWVVKESTHEKVHKTAHKSRAEAVRHQRALYAAEGMPKKGPY